MLLKQIVWGRTWEEAVSRTRRCLGEYIIRGIKTTIPLYRRIVEDEQFIKGNFTTKYIEDRLPLLLYEKERDPMDLVVSIASAIVAHSKL
jgi:pyruvate carboxylase subunit A